MILTEPSLARILMAETAKRTLAKTIALALDEENGGAVGDGAAKAVAAVLQDDEKMAPNEGLSAASRAQAMSVCMRVHT